MQTKRKKQKRAPKPKPKKKTRAKTKPKTRSRRAKTRAGPKAAASVVPLRLTAAPIFTVATLAPTAPLSLTAAPILTVPTLVPGVSAPAVGPMPAGVELLAGQAWKNYGTNLSTQVATVYRISNGPAKDPQTGMAALRWAVRHLAASGGQGSPMGSKWSFSPVAINPNAMFDLGFLSLQLGLTAKALANPAELSTLVHVQAGTTVQQVITYADNAGMSLKAMGGNCGQTIAGAISTGTHGGFTDAPGLPDMVRAIQLVAEDGKRHWIERPSKPVLSAGTVATWEAAGVEVHNDDEQLFNHAVVGLGAFGVIYSVVLDTAKKYWVHLDRQPCAFDDAMEKANFDRDFSGLQPVTPIDFATVLNPFVLQKQPNGKWLGGPGSAVTTWLERAPDETPIDPIDAMVNKPINDAGIAPILVQIANQAPFAVKHLVGLLLGLLYTARKAKGPFPVAYPLSLTHSPSLGMELGVPTSQSRRAFDVIVTHLQSAPLALPGVLAIRTTLQSKATLCMARWDTTTCFEFACLLVQQTEQVMTGVLDAMEASGIAFTLHLGMVHGKVAGQSWLTPARFEKMYGAQGIAAWVAARKTISHKGTVFGNALTRSLGLTS